MERARLKAKLKTVGENMSRLRAGQKISQTAVATAIGGSQSRISRWEKGTSSPRLEDFLLYADAINARPEQLLAGVLNDSVEQLGTLLDAEASAVVTDLVQLLHRRRPPKPPVAPAETRTAVPSGRGL